MPAEPDRYPSAPRAVDRYPSAPPAAGSTALLAAAQAGDADAFTALVAPHRRELEAHCYRMTGSVHDAEDALQESLVRAWRGLGGFDGRHPVRPWLYRIATNRCLTLIERRGRRELPTDLAPGAAAVAERAWLEPYPDARLDELASAEDRAVAREGVELAFVAALQRLPTRQRAVLLLCDVLGFSAREAAEALDVTVATVTSALQRARRTASAATPATSQRTVGRAVGDEAVAALAARYAAAWESGDVSAIVAMLAADVRYAMPPLTAWYAGHDAVRAFLHEGPMTVLWRFVPVRAAGQLAFGTYRWDPDRGAWVGGGIDVLTLRADPGGGLEVAEVLAFLDVELLEPFGLPRFLDAPAPGESARDR